ncbi:MAG: acetylornithine deacetylase [Frankiales bacterium]|jgi:acetylornithine deacetylase|nr:acetylornithine deacetylase [Frankiales bacterium]
MPEHPYSPWRDRLLCYLDEHTREIVTSLGECVRLPSVSGTEEENTIQATLAAQLGDLGLEVDHWQIPLAETLAAADFPGVEVDRTEAWGLVARRPGRNPADCSSLMLGAHVDVVPPGDPAAWPGDPFDGHVDERFVHGRGSCDMKGGLVAAVWALRALVDLGVPLPGDLLLACVQGEEDGGLGTYAMLARGWRADACVIPEPTSLDLVPACAGSLTFRVRVPGLASHASRRTAGVSAVEKFLPVFRALRALEARRNEVTDPLLSVWDVPYPLEIGRVSAGDWSSSVPDLLVAEGRYGVALGEDPDHAREQFAAAVAEACAEDPWLRQHPVTVEWWGGQFASGSTPVHSPIGRVLADMHQSVSDHGQQVWAAPYGSDLRLMTGIGGIPTMHYGPGEARLAHGPRERVPIDEVLATAKTLTLTALAFCSLDRSG